MSIHAGLRVILYSKFPSIKIIEKLDSLENFWIEEEYMTKILETKEIPKYFVTYIKNGVRYNSADNLLCFLRSSSNPHHTLDYLIPLKLEYTERPLLEVVKLFDKYGIRGKYNYDMKNVSSCLSFHVSYYYHCPFPLLIDVYSTDQDDIRTKLYKMFENQRFCCLEIDTRDWESMRDTILYRVECHLVKLNALTFMETVIKQTDEISDVVEELGENIVNACCSGDKFPFPLSEALAKFRILKGTPKYNEIYALFETDCTAEIVDNEQEQELESLDGGLDDALDSNDSDDNDSDDNDSDDNDSDDNDSDDNVSLGSNVVTQQNGNTIYVIGKDYVTHEDEYYLNHPTLIKIAIRSGIRKAEQYVDMTWKLISYINEYGKQAYQSLLNMMTMSEKERKEMFTLTKTTYEQNILAELNKAYAEIDELKSHIDLAKRKIEIEQHIKRQKEECQKDQIVRNATSFSSTNHSNINRNISSNQQHGKLLLNDIKVTPIVNPEDRLLPGEKRPTKIKASVAVIKSKDPIKDNELDMFLGLH